MAKAQERIPALEKIQAQEIQKGDLIYHALDGVIYGPITAKALGDFEGYVEINHEVYQIDKDAGYALWEPNRVVYRAIED